MSDAGQFQKVKAIINQDPQRQIVFISAAGKYGDATRKSLELLYQLSDGLEAGRVVTPLLSQESARLEAINQAHYCHVPLIKLK